MDSRRIRIESPEGRIVAEYRIRRGVLELRVPAEKAGAENANGSWRRLSAREFSAHLAQNPALGEWLRARAQRRSAPDSSEEKPSAA